MVRDIVGRVVYKSKSLGTCFLVNKKYIFTASHVLQDEKTKEIFNFVECNFEYDNQSLNAKLIYQDEINDFAILELQDLATSEFLRISREVIEKKDEWQSAGYGNQQIDIIKFNGYINDFDCNNRYEVYIHNQQDESEWKGVSGAPVVINNEIAGMILEEELGGNLKGRLKIISMEILIKKLLEVDPNILKSIDVGYHPLLQERISMLSDTCKELFESKTINKNNSKYYYHIFSEGNKSVDELANRLMYYIQDYGVELILDDQLERARRLEKRKIEDKIYKKKKHIIELIKNNYQLSHILLWMLIEGELKYPRIASYIIDCENNIPRDIYISNDDTINIVIGNGYLDTSIINLFQECINEIDQYLNKDKNNIIITDELVIKSLNYYVQEKISNINLKAIINDAKRVKVAILVGFDYGTMFKEELNSSTKFDFLMAHVEKYESEFDKIINECENIENVDISWFFIPFKNVQQFVDGIKNECV